MTDEPVLVDIKPAVLSQCALAAIGRVVRAGADLEDVINLWICKLAGMSESQAVILLGRSTISTKLAIAEGLAKLNDPPFLAAHKQVFDANMDRLLQCRNAVAHGTLVGKTPDSRYVFRTPKPLDYDGTKGVVATRAETYATKFLIAVADAAEKRIAAMPGFLGLEPLLEKRPTQNLEVIPVGRPQAKASAKPKRPQRSSPR